MGICGSIAKFRSSAFILDMFLEVSMRSRRGPLSALQTAAGIGQGGVEDVPRYRYIYRYGDSDELIREGGVKVEVGKYVFRIRGTRMCTKSRGYARVVVPISPY